MQIKNIEDTNMSNNAANQANRNNDIQFHDLSPEEASFLDEVKDGLSHTPKTLSPKFFYDQRGSELFDQICDLPEYYPTRTEMAILKQHSDEIAEAIGQHCVLIELGSGASRKIRLLLDILKPTQYTAIDISRDFLVESTRRLAGDFPWLEVHAVCADFSQILSLPSATREDRRVAFFPGSSIGNFDKQSAERFLKDVADMLGPNGLLLIGVDVKKDHDILNKAYNDEAGVTAAFNVNLLHRMQRELGADIDLSGFEHKAWYNPDLGRIEMHLVSNQEQTISLAGKDYTFHKDETIHTENSYKYSPAEFEAMATRAGFDRKALWMDKDELFSVQLFQVTD